MESLQPVIALILGLVLGGGVATLVLIALRARDRARVAASTALPDGTAAVLQGMDEVAVVVDTSLQIVAVSAPAELFGMHEDYALPGDELRALARTVRRTEAPETQTMRLKRGVEPRLVSARASVITPRLILIVIRDITERERVEEMRRDFVANTSHELKTPVGAVSLLAEAVESAADDPDQVRHFASRLSAEAARLSQLTSRIMNLSRLQSADDLTELRDVSVDEVVAAAIESQSVAADSAAITVARGGERHAYVRGDVQVLTEAVANLVANAIAYSPQGGQVGVGVKLDGGVVEIAVTDRGIGIPRTSRSACSNGSTVPTRRARAAPAARGWGCRSSSTRCSGTGERSRSGRVRGGARPSPCDCPPSLRPTTFPFPRNARRRRPPAMVRGRKERRSDDPRPDRRG